MNIITFSKHLINKKKDKKLIESWNSQFYRHVDFTLHNINQLLKKDQIVYFKKLKRIILSFEDFKEKTEKMKISLEELYKKYLACIKEMKDIDKYVESFKAFIDKEIIRTSKTNEPSPVKSIGTCKF